MKSLDPESNVQVVVIKNTLWQACDRAVGHGLSHQFIVVNKGLSKLCGSIKEMFSS